MTATKIKTARETRETHETRETAKREEALRRSRDHAQLVREFMLARVSSGMVDENLVERAENWAFQYEVWFARFMVDELKAQMEPPA